MTADPGFGELSELLRDFAEAMRSRLANLRSAAETLDHYPEMESGRRRQLQGVLLEESGALSELLEGGLGRLEAWSGAHSNRVEMAAIDLLDRLSHPLRQRGIRVDTDFEPAEGGFRVEVDLPALARGLEWMTSRLGADLGVDEVTLKLRREAGFAALDLLWQYGDTNLEEMVAWQSEILTPSADGDAPSISDLAHRHGGEAWFNLLRDSSTTYLRLLLPIVEEPGERPERPAP